MSMQRMSGFAAVALVLALSTGCQKSAQDHLKVADAFLKEKKYVDASLNYRKAIQADSKMGEAYFGLGSSELEQNNAQAAFEAMRQASQLLPDRMDVQAKFADLLLAVYQADPQNKALYDLLRRQVDVMTVKDRNHFDVVRMNGNLALLDRKAEDAIGYFKRANEMKPMQEYVVLGYVQALFDNNQPDEAEKLGRELMANKKDFAPVYDLLYRFAVAGKREAQAEEILKEKARNNPRTADAALQLAAHYARNGNQEAMKASLQGILDAQPPLPKAHEAVGDFYLQMRNPDAALAAYEAGAEKFPDQAGGLRVRTARVKMAQNKMDEALTILDGVLAKSPGDEAASVQKANLLLTRGGKADVEQAAALYQSVLQKAPKNVEARANLGRTQIARGDLEGARKTLQETVKEAPGADLPRTLLATVNLLDRKPQEAINAVEDILARNPKDRQARYLKFAALMEAKRFDEARPLLDDLIADFPNARDLRVQQGLLAVTMGRAKEAETIFTRLNREQGDLKAVAGLAEAFVGQRQFERAMSVLGEESRKNPQAQDLRLMMAKIAVRSGNYDQGIQEFQKLVAANPGNGVLLAELANAYREKGELPQAIEKLQEAARLSPKNLMAHLALGMAHYSAGNNAAAIQAYRNALALDAANPVVMNNLAYSLAESGKPAELDEALVIAQKAVRLSPNQLDYKDTLGWVYLRKKNFDNALQLFQSLCREKPDNASYQNHLGQVLVARNDVSGARRAFEVALRNKPSKSEESEIRKHLAALDGR
jgi:predicted Zn-dependent protease